MTGSKCHTPSARIAISFKGEDVGVQTSAKELSNTLDLPLINFHKESSDEFDLLLVVTGSRLELRETGKRPVGPVYVDFIAGPLAYRRYSGISRRQLFARAIGLRSPTITVVDATAGLGRDAFILACMGCSVTAVERSAVLAALFNDGIQRARKCLAQDAELVHVLNRIRLIEGDAHDVLRQLSESKPDVVYLDPMYPDYGKTALMKKEMRICRKLVGDDPDADGLMAVAMETAGRRVVVKRHPHDPPLAPNPSLRFSGRRVRYDVYLRHV